jgi:hypothetical protein
MIKCFFADVKSISSEIPRTKFNEAEIEDLANLILATDGLIRPLILKQNGLEQYTVVEGNLEYYAAVRAKEKDSRKAEMVNAFVIPANRHQSAIDQLTLLSAAKSVTVPSSTNISISIEQLTSIISQQLQPLQQELINVNRQLAEQSKILGSFNSERIEPIKLAPEAVNIPKLAEVIQPQEVADKLIAPKPEQIIPTPAKSVATKKPKSSTKKQVAVGSEPAEIIIPVATKSASAKKATATAKPKVETTKGKVGAAKSKVGLDPEIDPIKAGNTLNLINTLSQTDLLFRMEKSGLLPSAIKLASIIIDTRNSQPGGKFDSWEIVISEVSGLKAATAKNIINKLK